MSTTRIVYDSSLPIMALAAVPSSPSKRDFAALAVACHVAVQSAWMDCPDGHARKGLARCMGRFDAWLLDPAQRRALTRRTADQAARALREGTQ